MTPRPARQPRARPLRLWGGLAAVLLVGPLLLWVSREPVLVAAARVLTVDDARPPADYLVVLGGNAETRPFFAAELYRKGFAPRLLIFGHRSERLDDLGRAPSGDQIYRKILELEGVPPAAIVKVPTEVGSSWDEALALKRFLSAHPARRIILVTSAEHTRRAGWLFRKTLAGTPLEVRTAAARNLSFDETNWWRHEAGILAILHEYLKLPAYWIRSTLPLRAAEEKAG